MLERKPAGPLAGTDAVKDIRKEDTDWDRFLMNRPKVAWDPRKYLEFRLFWPYSSGIPGQWMAHQIDTVHWFTGLDHPRSVAANGGIYVWKDGRDQCRYLNGGFGLRSAKRYDQRLSGNILLRGSTTRAGGTKELYFSNGGMINLDTNQITRKVV